MADVPHPHASSRLGDGHSTVKVEGEIGGMLKFSRVRAGAGEAEGEFGKRIMLEH